MSYKDGVDNLLIYWDDDDGNYIAGQLLSGKIEVSMLGPEHNRFIRILKHHRIYRVHQWIKVDISLSTWHDDDGNYMAGQPIFGGS